MGGGLLQLVAYGAQDIYLTGNPQITFFKEIYRRHTNFSIEAIEQVFDGNIEFGEKIICTISRSGDLVTNMYLEVLLQSFEIPVSECEFKDNGPITCGSVAKTAFMNKLGNGMIKYIECEIGGQLIDRQYGEWIEIWNQITKNGYGEKHYNYLTTTDAFCVDDHTGKSLKLYIPLLFWFCTNPGLALPLVALQYHEVKINLYLEELKNLVRFDTQAGLPLGSIFNAELSGKFAEDFFIYSNGVKALDLLKPDNKARKYLRNNWQKFGINKLSLYCDYIYLDTDERRRFAQVSHEYLIQQVQFNGKNSISKNITDINIELDLNHPVKELIWVIENDPHLNFDEISDEYKGFISNCSVDPADRFTWLNNNGTCAISGEKSGEAWDSFELFGAGKETYFGITGMNLSESSPIPLNNRPKSAIRYWEQLDSAILRFNGYDRFSKREGRYFKWVQTYQHHSGFKPAVNNIYCYSFSIFPEYHQPSGCCNFSRIDSATLHLKLFKSIIGPKNYLEGNLVKPGKDTYYKMPVDRKIRIYATNYNVLRIMSGMGGLAFSN